MLPYVPAVILAVLLMFAHALHAPTHGVKQPDVPHENAPVSAYDVEGPFMVDSGGIMRQVMQGPELTGCEIPKNLIYDLRDCNELT